MSAASDPRTYRARRHSPQGYRAAQMYSLIITCKLNDVDPEAWLADVLGRIASHPAQRLDDLLPWNWKAERATRAQAA